MGRQALFIGPLSFIISTSLVPLALAQSDAPLIVDSLKVSRVIDGSTIELTSGAKIRYIGIKTPDTKDHPTKTAERSDTEATAANRRLVEDKFVKLEFDVERKDKYGRLLAYVYVDTVFVNAWLVENGYAHVYIDPPNIRYEHLFVRLQQKARQNNKGLWAKPSEAVKAIATTKQFSGSVALTTKLFGRTLPELRPSPDIQAPKTAVIPPATTVTGLDYEEEGYWKVNYNDTIGYILDMYIVSNEATEKFILDKQQFRQELLAELRFEHRELRTELEKRQRTIEASKLWVKVLSANVRQEPTTTSGILDRLEQGEPVYEQERAHDWLKVMFSNQEKVNTRYQSHGDFEDSYKKGWIHESVVSQEKVAKLRTELEKRQRTIEASKLWVKVLTANIRQAPTATSGILDRLEYGEPVYMQERAHDWLKVMFINQEKVNTRYQSHGDFEDSYKKGWIHESVVSQEKVANLPLILGMSQEMVLASWGQPDDINKSVGSFGVHEQWIYGDYTTTQYFLYFENGVLTSWQEN
jgi:endonuclease YncB( thermonuclease family)/uncharacterized protein YgiM (DUF1202 family)